MTFILLSSDNLLAKDIVKLSIPLLIEIKMAI